MKTWNELTAAAKMKLVESLANHWVKKERFSIKLASGKTIDNCIVVEGISDPGFSVQEVKENCPVVGNTRYFFLTPWTGEKANYDQLAKYLYNYCREN